MARYSKYAGVNSYKATHPTEENKEVHLWQADGSISSGKMTFLQFVEYNSEVPTGGNSQDDIKDTDKELGRQVEIGSRVNSIYHELELNPTVITPQRISTALIQLSGDFVDEAIKRMDNEVTVPSSVNSTGKIKESDLYGSLSYGTTSATDERLIYAPPTNPISSMRDAVFMAGQNSVCFSNFATHELYGWIPIEQKGSREVPRSLKRVSARSLYGLFLWNRSSAAINYHYYQKFNEYKEV